MLGHPLGNADLALDHAALKGDLTLTAVGDNLFHTTSRPPHMAENGHKRNEHQILLSPAVANLQNACRGDAFGSGIDWRACAQVSVPHPWRGRSHGLSRHWTEVWLSDILVYLDKPGSRERAKNRFTGPTRRPGHGEAGGAAAHFPPMCEYAAMSDVADITWKRSSPNCARSRLRSTRRAISMRGLLKPRITDDLVEVFWCNRLRHAYHDTHVAVVWDIIQKRRIQAARKWGIEQPSCLDTPVSSIAWYWRSAVGRRAREP
jgi:hypothetical protein